MATDDFFDRELDFFQSMTEIELEQEKKASYIIAQHETSLEESARCGFIEAIQAVRRAQQRISKLS